MPRTQAPEGHTEALANRARTVLQANANLRAGERLLVVADDVTRAVGELFYEAGHALGATAALMVIPEGRVAGEEPPDAVAAAMAASDVAVCATAKSLTHTRARIQAAAEGTRVVTMPGITMDMLGEGACCADYDRVEALTAAMTARLDAARIARIEKDGHVLTLNLTGRPGVPSPGVFRTPGASGNFPSGEAYIAPVENGADGTMVIDGSMVGIGRLKEGAPMIVALSAGRLTSIEGADDEGSYADRVAVLFQRPENGTIAELGIGTNECALLTGNILEDEKIYGTVHIAFGTNASFGGTTTADCHLDGIILKPTLYLDDELVIREGAFVV